MMPRWNRLRRACFSLIVAVFFAFAAHNCQAQGYPGAEIMAEPQAAGTTGSSANQGFSLIRNLQVSGFVNLTYGTFVDSEAIEYNKSKNSLSTARQLLQVDVNDTLGEHDRFFMRATGAFTNPTTHSRTLARRQSGPQAIVTLTFTTSTASGNCGFRIPAAPCSCSS